MNSMLTIIWTELRRRRWMIFFWSVALVAYVAITVTAYGSIKSQSAELDDIMKQLPTTVKNLFSDTGDLTSAVGYLSSKMYYLMLPLLFSILGIGLGASLLGREEQTHTLELLLARPVSRTSVLLAKALAGLAIMLAVGCVTTIALVVSTGASGIAIGSAQIIGATAMAFLISLVFSALAFTLAAVGHRARTAAVGISALVGLGGYILVSLAQDVRWLDGIKVISPYYYYHPTEILKGHFTTPEALGMISVTVLLITVACLAFRRRDIA